MGLISEEFPPYSFGGIASVCYDLARTLSEKKVRTTVLCGRSRRIAVEKINDYLQVARVPFLDVPPRFLWFQLQNAGASLKFLKNCTILHAVSPTSATVWTYLKKRIHSPLVCSVHGAPREGLQSFVSSPVSWWSPGDFGFHVLEYPIVECLFRATLRGSDHICVCSSSTLRDLNRLYRFISPDKVSVIYNGVNLDYIRNIKDECMKDRDERRGAHTVLYSGRLFGPKGIMHLIAAFNRLQEEISDVELKIFGTGPLEERAKKLVSKLGIRDRVFFEGFLPRAKLLAQVKMSDVVVIPSLVEAQPMFALETMACGRPLVAFDLPYAREFLMQGYNGFLAKPGDIGDLYEKILTLLLDSKLRAKLGQNAYRYVKTNHNLNLLVNRYLEVYEKVIETKKSWKTGGRHA